jgi:hypothetical protein
VVTARAKKVSVVHTSFERIRISYAPPNLI